MTPATDSTSEIRTLRAVVNPAAFTPFGGIADPGALGAAWRGHPHGVLAHLAHAAYLSRRRSVPLLRALGFESVLVEIRDSAQALVVADAARIVVAFRGTKTIARHAVPAPQRRAAERFGRRFLPAGTALPDTYVGLLTNDVLADLDFAKADFHGARVHRGFLGEFEKLWNPAIQPELRRLTGVAPRPVICCGHSLGGAMATLAGARWPCEEVVTFGEPRVGAHLERAFRGERATHVRYVLGSDPVPKLPPAVWPFGFRHHGERRSLTPRGRPDARYDHSILAYADALGPPLGE